LDLNGKIALVTGGGAGAGRAIASRLSREGMTLVVADVDDRGAGETVHAIEAAGGRAVAFHADVATDPDVEALFAFVEQQFGGVDVLVNDASALPSGEGPLDGWLQSFQVDLLGSARTITRAAPLMKRRGEGAIINVASTSALPHGRSRVRWPAYDAAKAGVIRLTTALAGLRESHGVRVNCIVPAWIGSPHIRAFYDPLTASQRKEMGAPESLLSPGDVAQAAVRLATDDTLSGRILVLDNDRPPALVRFADPGFSLLDE
jgi:NAD(P)-dependent dehydrogenase (short-subunit alcohol dehydrogenase family)